MPAFLEAIKGWRHMYEGSILTRKAAKNSCSFSPSVSLSLPPDALYTPGHWCELKGCGLNE